MGNEGMTMYKSSFFGLLLLAALVFSGCSTTSTTQPVRVDANASWALLPITNLSTTPRAGHKALSMVENILRTRGVSSIDWYQPEPALSLVALLDNAAELDKSLRWAKSQGYRYGLTGTVHEWHYKAGPDKEPVVGLSLKLVDLASEEVIWQSVNSKTGWGYTSLSGVAGKTIDAMLKRIRVSDR